MGFLFWLIAVVGVLALVVLLFPIRFTIEMNLDGNGGFLKFFLYRKEVWKFEKLRRKKDGDGQIDESPDDDTSSGVEDSAPTYVAAPPRIESEKCDTPEKTAEPAETKAEPEEKPVEIPAEKPAEEPPAAEPASVPVMVSKPEDNHSDDAAQSVEDDEPDEDRAKKRKLTDREFWNIILSPEFDDRALTYLKKILGDLFRLFCIRFEDCYVEGIRASYKAMGYGAALNGILKGYPYLEAWDLRMDWCGDTKFRIHGIVHVSTNLCRVFAFLIRIGWSALMLYLLFRKRRKHVLRTGELAELGFIRQKILDFIVED